MRTYETARSEAANRYRNCIIAVITVTVIHIKCRTKGCDHMGSVPLTRGVATTRDCTEQGTPNAMAELMNSYVSNDT